MLVIRATTIGKKATITIRFTIMANYLTFLTWFWIVIMPTIISNNTNTQSIIPMWCNLITSIASMHSTTTLIYRPSIIILTLIVITISVII